MSRGKTNHSVKRVSLEHRLLGGGGTAPDRPRTTEGRGIMVAARELRNGPGRGVVLALPESPLATAAAERLGRDGWRVWRAANCAEARRLVCRHDPEAVVL